MEHYINFKNISKKFPGQQALNDVSFSVRKGEIHALLGENGAGKSTLLNILFGSFPATSGDIFLEGKKLSFSKELEAIKSGIIKVHQEINIIPELTVAENVMLGTEKKKGIFVDEKQMNEITNDILKTIECKFTANEKIKNLSTGQKQMVQIAKALHSNAKIIAFDEPTSSLSDAEAAILFKIIKNLKEKGITILYISHKMNEIFELCDRATVLRDGMYINTLDISDTSKDEIVNCMVGRDVALFAKRTISSCAVEHETVLEVKGLTGEQFKNVSFKLKKGEILGFFGLVGAGRTEVMKGLFGANDVFSGEAFLGSSQLCKNPLESIKSKLAYISENRKDEGFVKNLCNADNIGLSIIGQFIDGIFINSKKRTDNAYKQGEKVGLKPNLPEFMTYNLSGGNVQKVILAKWLSTDAEVLIFDEPTKGIDIASKSDIYRIMEEIVESGKSIIMVSSELTEVIGMSDRIIVMREGSIVNVLDNEKKDLEESEILKYAVGGV